MEDTKDSCCHPLWCQECFYFCLLEWHYAETRIAGDESLLIAYDWLLFEWSEYHLQLSKGGSDQWSAIGIENRFFAVEYSLRPFADDLALVIVGKTEEEVKEKANASILAINSWMRRKKLVLAPPKTDIVVMSGRRKLRPVSVIVEGVVVEQKPRAKYLGVWLDSQLNFFWHVEECSKKATRTAQALA